MASLLGSKVPSFSIFDSQKQVVSNETISGKPTLILFFPAAYTGGCIKEMCSVRDDFSSYNNAGVDVLAISTDSVFTLAKFKEDQGLSFTVASDYNKEVSPLFNAQYVEFVCGMKGTAKRSAFLVDANGIVCYEEVLESAADQPNFSAILEAIKQL